VLDQELESRDQAAETTDELRLRQEAEFEEIDKTKSNLEEQVQQYKWYNKGLQRRIEELEASHAELRRETLDAANKGLERYQI
jgi:hypothetical protein